MHRQEMSVTGKDVMPKWRLVGFRLPRYFCECLMLHANLELMYDRHVASMEEKPACIDKLKAQGIDVRPILLCSHNP